MVLQRGAGEIFLKYLQIQVEFKQRPRLLTYPLSGGTANTAGSKQLNFIGLSIFILSFIVLMKYLLTLGHYSKCSQNKKGLCIGFVLLHFGRQWHSCDMHQMPVGWLKSSISMNTKSPSTNPTTSTDKKDLQKQELL